ncbi:MAG: hypothetical protein AAF744_02275 [Pseudomonadota bacterium]
MTAPQHQHHIKLAETGMALCVALGALLAIFVAAMTNLNRLIGSTAGFAAPEPMSILGTCLVTGVPLMAFYVAFARTAGRFGAPARLSRREVTLYFALMAGVLGASFARVWVAGLETTLLIVTLPPVLLFLAVCQNRAARGFEPEALEA